MNMTIEEFLHLKAICDPGRDLMLKGPLTEKLINEAVKSLLSYQVYRLELAKNTPHEEWKTLAFPRKDGLGNITPGRRSYGSASCLLEASKESGAVLVATAGGTAKSVGERWHCALSLVRRAAACKRIRR